jgi:two-component system, NarL family, sensor histidine kinase EvgS
VEGIEGILISGRDLTERSLARHQLEEAKLAAERVLAEKNEFLAVLGHEVRTPLQAIYAALDVVLRQILSGDDSREVVESATRSAESLLHTLDDLLVMSRADAKLAPVRRVEFDPHALAQEIVGLFDVSARKKGGSIRAVFGAPASRMVGDPARVRQILSNLVGNAVRYAGHTEIEIGFQEESGPDGAKEAVWEVRDRGPGLQEGDASRLFRKWERGREDIPGSGLGLAIVADMVQAMKGSLQAFGRDGGGLLVKIRFPLTAPLELGSDPHLELLVPKLALPAGRKPRVLVAEDDRTNQVVIRKQLANLGCESIITADGSLAVGKYDEEPFDLILLDCQMPVMNGFEAARQIRRRESESSRTRIPILAVTAWAMQEDQDLCLQSGMDEVLTKPLRPGDLSEALFRWIGHRKEVA